VIRIPVWVRGCEALSLSYNPRTGQIRAFVHWIPDKSHAELVNFLHYQNPSAYNQPLLIPSWLLQKHRKSIEAYRQQIDESILQTEFHVGYALPGKLYYKPPRTHARTQSNEKYGFEDVIRRLHASATELGSLSLEAKFGKNLGEFLLETEQKIRDWNNVKTQRIKWTDSEPLLDRINLNTNLYSTMAAQIIVLKDRVQSHINLVGQASLRIYMLIP
jgi:hypothetical protein